MEPDKKVIHAAVGDLWLGPVGSQQSQPVLRGDHVVWMDSFLRQV